MTSLQWSQKFNPAVSTSVRVSLDLFEGPLDLLLYLIQTQRIDITAISISKITEVNGGTIPVEDPV